MKRSLMLWILGAIAAISACGQALAAAEKPNILVIWGDDIGRSNIGTWPVASGLMVFSAAFAGSDDRREVADAETRHEVLDAEPRHELRDAEPRFEVPDASPRHEVQDAEESREVSDAEPRKEVP